LLVIEGFGVIIALKLDFPSIMWHNAIKAAFRPFRAKIV